MRSSLIIAMCLSTLAVCGQPDGMSQFEKWQSNFPLHRVQVFFNQSKYAPGDTVFFQTYLLNEAQSRIAGRQILRLSVFDCNNRRVADINFPVRNGSGANQLALPGTLEPGFYKLVIYDGWMKNFGSDLFYYHTLEVSGPNKVQAKLAGADKVEFFPEGGNFVSDVLNKVILKTPYENVSGELFTDTGGLITLFRTNELGMGMVVFKPDVGKTYNVRINAKQFDMPASTQNKISLLLTPQQDGKPVKLMVLAPPTAAIRKEFLSLLVASGGRLFFSAELKLDEKEFVQMNIPQDNLPEGVAQLWILDQSGAPVATRLFPVAKKSAVRAELRVSELVVATREKLSVDLALSDQSGKPVMGDFSVSVTSGSVLEDDSLKAVNTLDYDIASLDPYLQTIPGDFEIKDQWLITKSWTRYNWNDVMKNATARPKYLASNVLRKRGVAFDSSTGQPLGDSVLISVFFIRNTVGYEAYTNSKGEFDIVFLFDLWGNDELFYTVSRNGEDFREARIQWLDDKNEFPPACAQVTSQPDPYFTFSQKRSSVENSYRFYSSNRKKEIVAANPNEVIEDELSGADVAVNIHDYLLFPTMAETIREIIPLLKHRIVNKKSIVRAYIDIDNYVPTGDPLYIIDGVMTRDTEFFLSLNPDNLLTIKVVSNHENLRALGDLGKNGVVIVHTKKIDNAQLRASSTTLPVNGLNRPVSFNVADHSSSSRVPDFRSAVYWNPSITVSAEGRSNFTFYASDDTGPLYITVRGLTTDGQWFSARTKCLVKFNSTQK